MKSVTKGIFALLFCVYILLSSGCNDQTIELVLCENECYYNKDGNCYRYTEYAYEFDKESNLIRKTTYSNGILEGYYTYEYAEDGSLTEKIFRQNDNYQIELTYIKKFDQNGNETFFENYKNGILDRFKYTDYDNAGNVILERNYAYKTYYKIEKEYNEIGKLIKETETDYEKDYNSDAKEEDRTVERVFEKTYDEKGIPVSETITDKGGRITAYYEYGKEVGTEDIYYQYDGNGEIIGWEENKYDENGNCLVAKRYLAKTNEMTWHYEYEYDKNGNKISEKNFEGDVIDYARLYDENGKVVLYNEYDSIGNLKNTTTYSYEYDNQGRLLKEMTEYSDGSNYYYLYTVDNKIGELVKAESYSNGQLDSYAEYNYKKVKLKSGKKYKYDFRGIHKSIVTDEGVDYIE